MSSHCKARRRSTKAKQGGQNRAKKQPLCDGIAMKRESLSCQSPLSFSLDCIYKYFLQNHTIPPVVLAQQACIILVSHWRPTKCARGSSGTGSPVHSQHIVQVCVCVCWEMDGNVLIIIKINAVEREGEMGLATERPSFHCDPIT